MAIAQAVLMVIEDEGLQECAHSLGEYLLKQLLELQAIFPQHIGDVRYKVFLLILLCIACFRGMGLFIGLEIVRDRGSREPHPQLALRIIKRYSYIVFHYFYIASIIQWYFRMLVKHQVILSVEGTDKNVIKFKPPLCFNEENADSLIDHLSDVLSDEMLYN